MKTWTQLILFLGVIFVMGGAPALAAPDKAVAEKLVAAPDPSANPALVEFMKSGVKIYFMGERFGLNGWFMAKDKEVQIAYSSPDNQSLIIGVLFDTQGNNITTQQIKALYDSNKDVNAFLSSLDNQQALPGEMSSGMAPQSFPNSMGTNTSPFMPLSPGERLIKGMQDASGVNLGAPTAPILYMIADPNCPHCQATWKALRTAVFGGKLQIRLVPVGFIDPDSERAAAQFLRSANPLEAWDKYIGGDHAQLAGNPDATAFTAIHSNRALADAWHIAMTPYMVYRAKDGRVKIVQGQPDHPDTLVDDIGP